MRIFADFHHVSLYNSLRLTFQRRLGGHIDRPIGMEWYHEGFWAIYPHPDTAKQYLDLEQAFVPADGTPVLNDVTGGVGDHYFVRDGEYDWPATAVTLETFKQTPYDYLICSIPQHIKPFLELRRLYQPNAKVIFQAGNNWSLDGLDLEGVDMVLASIKPQDHHLKVPVVFYHQEFDTEIFSEKPIQHTRGASSFINVLDKTPGWADFTALEDLTRYFGMAWRSYGGQCRDGCIDGAKNLALEMEVSDFIFHVKHTGDGFGHIIHNAYAVGRPIITRSSHYQGLLAEELLVPGTFIDLDKHSLPDVKNILHKLVSAPEMLEEAGAKAAARFREVVNYDAEAEMIREALGRL